MSQRRPFKVTTRDLSGATREDQFYDLDDVAAFVAFHRDMGDSVTVWGLPDGKGRRYLDQALAPCRERHRGLL